MKDIFVKIGKGGKITIEVDGVEGSGCEALTQAIASALGVTEQVNHKPQYYNEIDQMKVELYEGE